jgi:Cdc6-like AAA superfamily ATPase
VAVSLPEIVGRDQELAATAAFLDGDLPAALVLAGEAGIGKTTVWRAALEQAREHDLRVLVCRPAESEAHLSYAGLSDLLEPVLDGRSRRRSCCQNARGRRRTSGRSRLRA